MDKKISMTIAMAQLASDCGKGLNAYEMSNERSEYLTAWRKDHAELAKLVGKANYDRCLKHQYKLKDQLIEQACQLIARSRSGEFHFWWGEDDRGNTVVYFDWKIEGKRYQCSFHRPDGIPQRWRNSTAAARRWDRKNCSKACIELLKHL